ncbi:MAG: ABC transporter permease [Clostridium sp.]|nr:ABC transporter permease [Clostridium sp.]
MYTKLIFKNAARSAKNYLIYIVTMTICVMLFYAFLSISSRYYRPDIGSEYDFTMLGEEMKLSVCGVTLLLLFLIRYVNNYMLKSRQKEFAVQAILGMEQKTISRLFFAETLVMGAFSIFAGIFLGMICSQFITAMLLSSYGQAYRLTWTLFPDTAFFTVCFFTGSLFMVGLFNIRAIRKIKIIDMLSADRLNEPRLDKSRYMAVIGIFHGIMLLCMAATGISNIYFYFDSRLALPVRIMFWGNVISPIAALLWLPVWLLYRRKGSRPKAKNIVAANAASINTANANTAYPQCEAALLFIEMLLTLICLCFAASMPRICMRYYISFGSSALGSDTGANQYLLFLLTNLIFLIYGIIYLSGKTVYAWKEKFPLQTYKGQNLFFFGQVISKLTTTSKTMTLICLTLALSIFLFLAAPALAEWALGYLEIRALYDVQISTSYNRVSEKEKLPRDNYELVDSFFAQENITAVHDCTFNLYLPCRADFHKRIKQDFPIVAISLSDYNALRKMLSYSPISLGKNEFTTQWQAIATPEDREAFLESHASVSTDNGNLTLAQISYYEENLGETLYNLYTDVIYVFPDEVCRGLLAAGRNRYVATAAPLSYEQALTLEKLFVQQYPETSENEKETQYYLRTKTQQINGTTADIFVLRAMMTYGGVVLMVICLTILSLQQLLDAPQYQYRFGVLRKLGVEEKEIDRLVLKQLSLWFGLPVGIAVLASVILAAYFFTTIAAQISAYIGFSALFAQVAAIAAILAILLICYLGSTWILFKGSIYSFINGGF